MKRFWIGALLLLALLASSAIAQETYPLYLPLLAHPRSGFPTPKVSPTASHTATTEATATASATPPPTETQPPSATSRPTETLSPTTEPATPTIGPSDTATLVPTETPSATPSATPTETPPPSPTREVTPTRRPSPTPTPVPMPGENIRCVTQGSVEICASVSEATPQQYGTVTAYGRLRVNGVGQSGQPLAATWHYRTTTVECFGTTGDGGLGQCSRSIGAASIGHTVSIHVNISGYVAVTSFTPR